METPHKPAASRDLMGGLRKGLELLAAFDGAHTRLTQSEAARRCGITPAAARRCLITLCDLGYACSDGKHYWLDHGVLGLAYAYASSTRMPRLLQPALDALSERTHESATLAVLHRDQVLVAARSTGQRSLGVGLGLGSRLPLHCSATGRVLLAALPDAEREHRLGLGPLAALTPNTITQRPALRRLLTECRREGYALSNEEIELGVRSLAVPIQDGQGRTVAAMSVASRADRITARELVHRFLPSLLRTQAWARERL